MDKEKLKKKIIEQFTIEDIADAIVHNLPEALDDYQRDNKTSGYVLFDTLSSEGILCQVSINTTVDPSAIINDGEYDGEAPNIPMLYNEYINSKQK